MEWLQAIMIAGSTVGSMFYMHRQTTQEMKDFHGRLCTLEERYLQMMQRHLEGKPKKEKG